MPVPKLSNKIGGNPVAKTRASKGRSRSGCLRCKERRVKVSQSTSSSGEGCLHLYIKPATCVRQLSLIQIRPLELESKLIISSVTSCVLAPGVRSVHMSVSIPSLARQAGIVKSPHSARRLPRSQKPTVKITLLALPPNPKRHLPSCLTVHYRMDIRFHR